MHIFVYQIRTNRCNCGSLLEKQKRSFHSARWDRDYSPNLCWVTSHNGQPLQTSVHVLDDFPHSQHRPIVAHVGIRIPLIRSLQKPRWNFRKAKWAKFSEQLEQSIICIPNNGISVTEAYLILSKSHPNISQDQHSTRLPAKLHTVHRHWMSRTSWTILKLRWSRHRRSPCGVPWQCPLSEMGGNDK